MNKYGAKSQRIDGLFFASTKEANRYKDLKLLFMARQIDDLQCQVPFRLVVGNELICTYRADFVYLENGKQVVEDTKGMATREYIIKRKLMKAIFGITILET